MCRFLCYLGPPVTLASVVLDPPYCLRRQAHAPRHQRVGAINADGFGVGWYDFGRRPEPARFRTARPIWADRSFESLAGLVVAPAVVAAVRDATPPSPVEETGSQPFTWGPWLFAHNGKVEAWGVDPEVKAALRRSLSDRRAAGVEGGADSEILFALALDELDRGATPAGALAAVVARARAVAPSVLNLLLTDGHRVVATAGGDSLFVLRADDSVVVASEPYDDDPAWERVPDGSMVEAGPGWVSTVPL
ncbi:MAG: gamma-glutamyl hercynylcysteine S-oxide hydrolase [Actinomycetota bacterium]|jgi:glutamine amidotransferase|nr:gamma-glutamyl hercynylcysteine S-oxide hydrolase [Actinomycetota bacterium]